LTQIYPPKLTFTEAEVAPGSHRGTRTRSLVYALFYPPTQGRVEAAIKAITSTSTNPTTSGTIRFLHLDPTDLRIVKAATNSFARQECKLQVLFNNAGTGANSVEPGQRTAQGFEPMVGFHCIATLPFTQLLVIQLRAAAADTPSVL
jgi:NADP-dependent 3-hydroxy acid dehydrogenase YdfG